MFGKNTLKIGGESIMVTHHNDTTATTTKYLIRARIEIDGIVDKPDVVGAIFGQTEGLLGKELDLRELQKTGRIGRIHVQLNSKGGRSTGIIVIPSSLSMVETAILAAVIETVDRVGPCTAKVYVEKIEDMREAKRKKVIQRAVEILRKWSMEVSPESQEITEAVMRVFQTSQITKYGSEGLPAGPNIDKADTIIIVEGRADVLNLLKHGFNNVIAVEGTSIPKTIIDLSREKTAVAFVDGDRGGELILRELLQVADVDFVARAPPGKEVEELTHKEIIKSLRNKVPVEQAAAQLIPSKSVPQAQMEHKEPPAKTEHKHIKKVTQKAVTLPIPKELVDVVKTLQGTSEAVILNDNNKEIQRVPVSSLTDTLKESENVHTLIFDGIVTQRLVDVAAGANIKIIVGARKGQLTKIPYGLKIYSFNEVMG